jgi:serine/threonine protein kinase
MGTVYLGQDMHTQQELAVKELHANLSDEGLITRFKREGEALRDLNHPNIKLGDLAHNVQ